MEDGRTALQCSTETTRKGGHVGEMQARGVGNAGMQTQVTWKEGEIREGRPEEQMGQQESVTQAHQAPAQRAQRFWVGFS